MNVGADTRLSLGIIVLILVMVVFVVLTDHKVRELPSLILQAIVRAPEKRQKLSGLWQFMSEDRGTDGFDQEWKDILALGDLVNQVELRHAHLVIRGATIAGRVE